jgi:hypothetical protein
MPERKYKPTYKAHLHQAFPNRQNHTHEPISSLSPNTNVKGFQVRVWADILGEHTDRQLTFPEDGLPVIAGVAKELASV